MAEMIVVICPTAQGAQMRQTGTTGNSRMADMRKVFRRKRERSHEALKRTSELRQ
jgi:hypothetical protein